MVPSTREASDTEFFLPDFFVDPADIARAGRSNPVRDIAFPECVEQNVMLVAERGGVRNLGLDAEEPFAFPHKSRVLRYEFDDKGVWQLKGRYDVGFYDRKTDREPFVRANSSGGVDFGYGYSIDWTIDLAKPDQFVWMTGDSLCSPWRPASFPTLASWRTARTSMARKAPLSSPMKSCCRLRQCSPIRSRANPIPPMDPCSPG